MAEGGRPRTNRGDRTLELKPHTARVEVEILDASGLPAENVKGGLAIVGDRVGEGNFPVGDAAVDDFDGRNHVVRRSIDVRSRRVGGSDVLAENDRNLGLGLWLQNPRARKEERKSVVSGKSESVRVDLGGSRIIKKP